MARIAVIATGGKQYKVKEGETIKVEKLDLAAGEKVTFDTLLVAETDGSAVSVGTPSLGAKVSGEVLNTEKQDKVTVVKYKSKTRYKKTVGHRQLMTSVKILSIA
ncbi:50S ribosomal protein L21 [Candidatus Falkowbacteria bacterium HGW-Falkowbacteria-2]|uniref:Large ribosomal subunit protein bL21 n=1 Tax=Candidatus Falkowbacteria bacterium HGW-Falkowbacteria-2 TaxID=2013769 RepID=A0A2N2E1M4_9BACT|nr:MAG: 50S ribosomal protein L21 [Candidatus Falkowbacteria bacterium HGW-Falkowbacteria-2]